ncbi:hypothetical protein KI387_016205, partial [Taxus chinensis]
VEGNTMAENIPVLDMSRCGEKECIENIRQACEELGCFRIVNHGIATDLLRQADLVCRDVFKLPKETKIKNVSPVPFAGYYGGVSHDRAFVHETLGIAEVPNPEAIRDFSNLMWSHGNQNFCKIMEEYTYNMMQLSKRLHQIILESLGLSKYYDSHFNHGKTIFRMNMYDVLHELSLETVGLPPHTDSNSITILYEDEIGGLQVENKTGDWINVNPIPNTFVVFIGDSFEAWSNRRIRSVKHRVIVKRPNSRLSLAFFNTFPEKMEIKAPPELVDDEHPQCYKAFLYGHMIKYRMGDGRMIQKPLLSFAF